MAKKVMIVDDSRTVRLQVRLLLADAGYEILEASDGLEGLEKIRATPDLALVICDVNMPRMNGLEMLSLVKRDPAQANLCVLMLTTEAQPTLMAKAKAAGARGWIVKPFRSDLLVSTVNKIAATTP